MARTARASLVSYYIVALSFAVVFLASTTSDAFASVAHLKTNNRDQPTTTTTSTAAARELFSSASSGDQGTTKPDLVDQALFRAAINRVADEIEAQYRSQKLAEGTNTEEPSEEELQWLAEQARAREDEQNCVFLVGKLDVNLPIDTQPELDLTESIGPLVLVTNVWGRTASATGMQEFDTLTRVGVDDPDRPFVAKTKCTTLEETAGALTAAAQHAMALGKTEIQLEVQRLIKGYYAPEDSV